MSRDALAPIVRLAVLASSLLLSGCLSLGDESKTRIYAPQIAVSADTAWPQAAWTLLVAKPRAGVMLDSERIAVQPEPGQLQVYKEAAWTDPLPELLQAALLKAFEDSGKIAAVARQASGVRGDATLLLDIRHFEAVYRTKKDPPTVTLEVQAKLVVQATGKVVAARTFRAELPAASEKVPAVTRAFDAASQQLLAELVPWTLGLKPLPPPAP